MNRKNPPRNTLELMDALREKGVPETETAAWVERFLERKARKNRIPLHGTFELTPVCNLDCKMCYVHLAGSQFDPARLLTADVWEGLMEQARLAGMGRATLTGGECLTYPDFDRLYLFLEGRGIRTGLLTNGVLIGPERIGFFQAHPPRRIQVTLYGSSEEDYEAVTGRRAFETVRRNILGMRDAGLPVAVTITPSRFMRNDIRPLLETAQSLDVPYNISGSLIEPRENTGRKKEDLSNDQYLELFRIRSELDNRSLLPADPAELPDENRTADPRGSVGLRCGGGKSSFTIQYDGCMSPCPGLYDVRTRPLETGFPQAWRELNERVAGYRMPGECEACAYRRVCLTCPAAHRSAPEGHCDPTICERTRAFIRAGLIPVPQGKGSEA